jgi:predicted transcriptional regulator
MAVNSYTEWTEEDIRTLDIMYRNNIPTQQIAKALERTVRAVEHALKNLLLQEVLHTNTRQVADKYNISPEAMYYDLVPEKYFLKEPKSTSLVLMVFGGVAAISAFMAFSSM